jgi:predicted amidohydrolase YtcJ
MLKRMLQILLLTALLMQCTRQEPADSVFKGGDIYTVNDQQPIAHAVAVKDGRIIFVGEEADVQKFIGDKTTVIDLAGKVMTPGFIEGHGHIMHIGYNELELDLLSIKSYDELIANVKEAASKAQPGQWILGRGWHQDKWDVKPDRMIKGFPLHHKLSEVSPDNPVFLEHASGHAALANANAMELSGVNALALEKLQGGQNDGGEVIRDELGNPTGLFNERAMELITRNIPAKTIETDRQALALAMKACARNGITSFHDAHTTRENVELFRSFKKEGKLDVRMYMMLSAHDPSLLDEWFQRGPEIDTANLLTIRSIKLHCDGALGSRGAWLLEPYSDRPDFYGMATYPMDSVLAVARQALKHGFQVCSHAIGDRTNREILDRYEKAFQEYPEKAKDHRFRIEHAQHLHPSDIPRFGKLGVIASMQAIHMSSDRPWAIERLGEKRIKEGAYMWQSLLSSGAKIVNGTDAPVEPINPVACFYASVTRKTLKGEPEGGYEPKEKMTREQALRSYTLDAAYGAFEDDIKGSIEVGKLADFTVFSQDLMTVPEDDILGTSVEMTVVGGRVVFQK